MNQAMIKPQLCDVQQYYFAAEMQTEVRVNILSAPKGLD